MIATKLCFTVLGDITTKADGMEIDISGDNVTISVYYDFNQRPLKLKGTVKPGDTVEINMIPYRIELIINGIVVDEEWPAGNAIYKAGLDFDSSLEISASEYEYEKPYEPSIIDTFCGAEGWRPGGGVFVGDCMPYVNDGVYHVLYLKDRHHHGSKWGFGAHQWEHISTSDFKTWNIHPTAVEITKSLEGSICTGSWVKKGEKEYLFYTVRMADKSPAPICRSVSDDGYHFEKDENFSFTLSDKYWAESARDPKVIMDSEGIYHMLLTTSLAENKRGCLAHLISEDLETWTECEEPIYVSDDEEQPECPDYIEYRGRYYLIFSLRAKGQYLYSEKPFTDWKIPKNPIIPCHSVPKCAVFDDKIIFAGFINFTDDEGKRYYAGTLTFKTATADEAGEFIYE